ncbi:MAG TPA: permease-like cell division protein FtsX [Gemmatimonadales bacterium]|nr:permease-like cell division protein FtsX [Gemmatimonadales bacterium]
MNLALREALLGFRRAPLLSVLSVTTIAFALFVVGLFGLVALNLRDALAAVEERVEIVVYLRRGTPIEAATLAIADIETFPEVASATYVSDEEALARARRELPEFQGVFSELRSNPLPASIEVRLKPGFRSSEHVNAVADRLRGFRFAEDIRYGREWIEKLDRLRDIAALVGLAVGAAFAVASVIIIGTTIRMGVLHRSREIAIMRLVGATDGFIRRPFLLEGALKGALGGIAAVALSHAAFITVDRLLFDAVFFEPVMVGSVVLFGTTLGLLASALSVRRHLRGPSP